MCFVYEQFSAVLMAILEANNFFGRLRDCEINVSFYVFVFDTVFHGGILQDILSVVAEQLLVKYLIQGSTATLQISAAILVLFAGEITGPDQLNAFRVALDTALFWVK